MSLLGAFCNQLVRFFEELEGSYPEEKSISMALEAIRAGKKANPRLVLDMFYEYIYRPCNDLIVNHKDAELKTYANTVLSSQFNELMPALMIFDKYWPTMTDTSRDAVWNYLHILCKLCETIKAK